MSLSSLPTEIVSRICRYIGLEVDPGNGVVYYNNDDLKSPRLTCRELYAQSTYDAAIRYGPLLEELEVYVDYPGLCDFLHITSIPAFRDRIRTIMLHGTRATATGDNLGIPWIKSAIRELRYEEECTFEEASETVHLFAACFENLKRASRFEDIHATKSYYSLLPAALARSQFPRKIAIYSVNPQHLAGHEYRTLTSSSADCSPYTKGIEIDAPELAYLDFMSKEERKQARRNARQCNDRGYHIRGFEPCHAELSRFVAAYRQVEELGLNGCETHPRLRFCDGCHAVFAKHVVAMHFSNLSRFKIDSIYISGGRLRRFIKSHSTTLREFDCCSVSLTDGSWRSIAEGLLRLPQLEKLHWAYLFQKHEVAVPNSIQLEFLPELDIVTGFTWEEKENIGLYLEHFLRNFCTRMFDRKTRRRLIGRTYTAVPRARYHEVVMYMSPSADMTSECIDAYWAINRYAKEVFTGADATVIY